VITKRETITKKKVSLQKKQTFFPPNKTKSKKKKMSTPICVEDFGRDILLRRPLSDDEKRILCGIILHVLYNFQDAADSRAYAWAECRKQLAPLVADLEAHFQSGNAPRFLRLSSLSPKDAYFVLAHNRFFTKRVLSSEERNRNDEQADPPVSLVELQEELRILRVRSAYECLVLLCHSYRTYIDLENDETRSGNALLLLPWRADEFWYASETRVMVRDGRILTTSEYYSDLVGGYSNVPELATQEAVLGYLARVIAFVQAELRAGRIPLSTAVDVALLTGNNDEEDEEKGGIMLIECNTYDDTFDTCLFDSLAEIEQERASNGVECRWRDAQGTFLSQIIEPQSPAKI